MALTLSGSSLVVCPLTVFLPFLEARARVAPQHAVASDLSGSARISAFVSDDAEKGMTRLALQLRTIHFVAPLHDALQRLLSAPSAGQARWQLGWSQESRATHALAACTFCVLQAVGGAGALQTVCGVEPGREQPAAGAAITAAGAAFGTLAPDHFHAVQVSGILSAPILEEKGRVALWLSDAPTLPGMEGGPVALLERTAPGGRTFVGLLLPPLLVDGGGAEVSIVAPLELVASHVASGPRAVLKKSAMHPPSPAAKSPAVSAAAKASAVAVRSGSAWASGFLVSNDGHIFTVAHLFPDGKAPTAQVGFQDGRRRIWIRAEIVHIFQNWMDLAVLKVEARRLPNTVKAVQIASAESVRAGDGVVVAGFPSFHPAHAPFQGPILTAGSLAKVGGRQRAGFFVARVYPERSHRNPPCPTTRLVFNTTHRLSSTRASRPCC